MRHPLAPTPAAGARLHAATRPAVITEDFRGFAFLSAHAYETAFTISQSLRNSSLPALLCPGSLVGRGTLWPRLGLTRTAGTTSPALLPGGPTAPGGLTPALSLCSAKQAHTPAQLGSEQSNPQAHSVWVSVTQSWGLHTGVRRRSEPHEWLCWAKEVLQPLLCLAHVARVGGLWPPTQACGWERERWDVLRGQKPAECQHSPHCTQGRTH